MSRTDKTRPLWVQMADTPMVTSVPVHDHRFGPCTLPTEVTPDSIKRGGCHWVATAFYGDTRGGNRERYYLLREERRRSRHRARRDLKEVADRRDLKKAADRARRRLRDNDLR